VKVPEALRYDESGLLPVVVQDHASGDVLMVAWANAEAMALTVETGQAHFWSRSRRSLWRKGETSGHTLKVRDVRTDCDSDTVLLVVEPSGPACHTGTRTCFGERGPSLAGVLDEVESVIASRDGAAPAESYTARLLARGLDQALKKVGEECTEVVLAAKGESDERLAEESADLLFHVLVALRHRRVPLARVLEVLARRRGRREEAPA
jgi:phosphoribosyl-ATP pyrophosphohydrolase/phosphoribosyl-AMP cyclohydrolase